MFDVGKGQNLLWNNKIENVLLPYVDKRQVISIMLFNTMAAFLPWAISSKRDFQNKK